MDVEEAASTNAVLKFREKNLECQQACSWITLVPLYGYNFHVTNLFHAPNMEVLNLVRLLFGIILT